MSNTANNHSEGHKKKLLLLSLAALGVVYGDIGTSPLYAISEIFFGHGQTPVTTDNIYGAISLVLWSITLVVTLKYLIFVLRADNDGEGGVFALFGLISKNNKKRSTAVLMVFLMLAAGLLFGDGMITPAISVLSAVEGLKIATPAFDHFVIPITIAILTGLFLIQKKGTSKVGSVFGPIVIIWFLVIGVLGLKEVINHPAILYAFNPIYGINMIKNLGISHSLLILGAVMLAITGGEALYADMGHFGKQPIRLSWFILVYPALILNYLGQGAYLLGTSDVPGGNIFFGMVPQWFLYPIVILATLATIIASQALISGAFSLAQQAIALNLFPRLKIVHTHHDHEGQIYLGFINWSLYVGCVLLVIIMGSSTALAAAYGLAVSGVMLATSLAMMSIAHYYWKWSPLKAGLTWGVFALVDASFLFSNSLKFFEGGFIPVSIGVILFLIMITWQWGRKITFDAYTEKKTMKISELVQLKDKSEIAMDRSMLIMAPKVLNSPEDNTPALMQYFLERYDMLPKNIIFLSVTVGKSPFLHENRYDITNYYQNRQKGSISSVTVNFGFMEDPNVEGILEDLAAHHKISLPDHKHWIVLVSKERLITDKNATIFKKIKLGIFSILRKFSQPGYYYFGVGNNVNLGMEVIPMKV